MADNLIPHQTSLQWFSNSLRAKLKISQWLTVPSWSTPLVTFSSWNTTTLLLPGKLAVLLILMCYDTLVLKWFLEHASLALHWTISSASSVCANFKFLVRSTLALFLILQFVPSPTLPVYFMVLYLSYLIYLLSPSISHNANLLNLLFIIWFHY